MVTKNAIDGYLGAGWYMEWREMDRSANHLIAKMQGHARHFRRIRSWPHIWEDAQILGGVSLDYERAMKLIAAGKTPNREEVGRVHDVYTLAIGVAEADVEALDALVAFGFAFFFTGFPIAVIERKAKRLKADLKELEKELRRAKREIKESYVQSALNIGIGLVQLALPPVGLFARLGIVGGQMVADYVLGPSGSASSHVSAGFGESVSDVAKLGKKGTAGVSSMTLAFDVGEIKSGYRRRDYLKAAIDAANRSYDVLMRELIKHRVKFKRLDKAMRRFRSDASRNTWSLRNARDRDIARYRYVPGRKSWR